MNTSDVLTILAVILFILFILSLRNLCGYNEPPARVNPDGPYFSATAVLPDEVEVVTSDTGIANSLFRMDVDVKGIRSMCLTGYRGDNAVWQVKTSHSADKVARRMMINHDERTGKHHVHYDHELWEEA